MNQPPPADTGPRVAETDATVGHAKRLTLVTLLSRLFGLLRDVLLAGWLGNSALQDRFVYAFIIPNLFRRLFGEGALSAAFVPTLTAVRAADGPEAGVRLYQEVASLLAVCLVGVMLAVELVLLGVYWWADPGPGLRVAIGLTAVMLPFAPLICFAALMGSVLNVRGRFVGAAAMPILLSVVQIVVILWFARWLIPGWGSDSGAGEAGRSGGRLGEVVVLAASVVLAGLLQVGMLGWLLHRAGFPLVWRWNPRSPGVRRMLTMLLPAALGAGVLQLEPLIDGQIILLLSSDGVSDKLVLGGYVLACPLAEGTQSSVAQAQRLYQFPLGVLAISLATAVFPALARQAAQQDRAGVAGELRRALRLGLFEGIPAGVGLALLAVPITSLLFERGNFTAENTQATAWVLRFYALGVPAFCCIHLLNRAFYALGDARTPVRLAMWMVLVNVVGNLVLVFTPLGAGAFGLTAACSATGLVLVSARKLSARLGEPLLSGAVAASALRTVVASGVMAAAVLGGVELAGLWTGGPDGSGGRFADRLLAAGLPMAAGVVSFGVCSWLLGAGELKELVGRSRRASRRQAGL